MSAPLFQITHAQLETGLRGVPVGYCTTSFVDPAQGLFYRGILITRLASWPAEKVIYLLYYGKEPKDFELEDFKKSLAERGEVDSRVIAHITQLPQSGNPMALFSCALRILGMYEAKGDYREDCLNVIAKIPTLAACVINHHGHFGNTPSSEPGKGYVENFVHLLQCLVPEGLTEVFRLFTVLHYDHGGGNLSTFVGKAVASGLADMYGSLAAAMDALAGPRHGSANQEALHFLQSLQQHLGDQATPEQIAVELRRRLAAKELLYGFGHAVLRVEDPRATMQYALGAAQYPHHPLIQLALNVRDVGTRVLKENPKVADPYPNVDAISGALLTAAGFPFSEYYTILFGMARCVGIAIQIVYERCEARKGKGTPIIRPRYFYRGSEGVMR